MGNQGKLEKSSTRSRYFHSCYAFVLAMCLEVAKICTVYRGIMCTSHCSIQVKKIRYTRISRDIKPEKPMAIRYG